MEAHQNIVLSIQEESHVHKIQNTENTTKTASEWRGQVVLVGALLSLLRVLGRARAHATQGMTSTTAISCKLITSILLHLQYMYASV